MFEFGLLIWIACGVASEVIAANRGANRFLWFGLGVLFGPFALAFAFTAGEPSEQCPFCKSRINAQALRCPKCEAHLSGTQGLAEQRTIAGPASNDEPFCCGQCRELLPAGSKFCDECGAVVRVRGAQQ